MAESEERNKSGHRGAFIAIGVIFVAVIVGVLFYPTKHQEAVAQSQKTPEQLTPTVVPPPSTTAKATGRSWLKINGVDGLPAVAYIDTESITCSSDGNVRVWEKFEYPTGSSARLSSMRYLQEHGLSYSNYESDQSLIEISCVNRTWRQHRIGFFDFDDKEIGHSTHSEILGDWQDSPDLSISGAVVNRACEIKECM